MIKRGEPTDNDYIYLDAGEERSVTIDLSDFYNMDKKGNYRIIYQGTFKYKELGEHRIKRTELLRSSLPKYYLKVHYLILKFLDSFYRTNFNSHPPHTPHTHLLHHKKIAYQF